MTTPTLRDKAPLARRTADEFEALLPSVAPEPQKPIGPSEKEQKLAHDLALLAVRNSTLMKELEEIRRGTASERAQHEGDLAIIAALREENDAFRDELRTVKKKLEHESAPKPEPAPDTSFQNEKDAGLEEQAKRIRELTALVEERDRQLENALTPEDIEDVKHTFATAVYNIFKEVDNHNPGFLNSVLANPKISQERKDWIIEAFRANGEEIVLDL